jgi:c-di-GMP-binding flagellar brake protein YcgR
MEKKMESVKIRIAVISMNDGGGKFYHLLIDQFKEVTIEFYKTIGQFKKECSDKKYTGIIVDMYTIVSASTEEKGFFFSLQKGLPVMQMKHGFQPLEFSGFVDPKKVPELSGIELVESFIRSNCMKAQPRGIRMFARKKILLKIQFLLSKKDPPFHSELLDLSQDGCFIIVPHGMNVQNENRIWITINDLKDHDLIPCTVKWKGTHMANDRPMIGLGAQFEKISKKQKMEILEILKNAHP